MVENAVPAEKYWENYFTQHPDQRPAHIVYYDGNPSEAVEQTLRNAGILSDKTRFGPRDGFTGRSDTQKRDGKLLGFDENYVHDERRDAQIQFGHAEFNEIARKKIAERYGLDS